MKSIVSVCSTLSRGRARKLFSFKTPATAIRAAGVVLLTAFAAQMANAAQVGATYYTQYNFWTEKGKVSTTNYSRGELIPFNTPAKLVSIDKKKFIIDVKGQQIQIINKPKFTQRSPDEIADLLLKSSQVSLSGVSSDHQADMRNGILRLGMTKDQAIVTRGYPPRHKTPSTEANRWIYWSSRFVQRTIVFANGRVSEGRGLY
ncbi:MAG: hypothetical protein AAGI88_11970 [Pseudomonadota bacterium]